jgi:hypothetical protein
MLCLVNELCPNGKPHAHIESGVLHTSPEEVDEGSDPGSRLVFRCYCSCGIDGEACNTEEEALSSWHSLRDTLAHAERLTGALPGTK